MKEFINYTVKALIPILLFKIVSPSVTLNHDVKFKGNHDGNLHLTGDVILEHTGYAKTRINLKHDTDSMSMYHSGTIRH